MVDKIPPQAIDSENIVIGTLLNQGNAYSKIADILTVDCFYNHKNKRITNFPPGHTGSGGIFI